jgi:hypothetical protein
VRDVSDNMSGNPNNSTWDSSFKLYGNGSNKMVIPDNAVNPGAHQGNYAVPLLPGPWDPVNNSAFLQDATELPIGGEVWVTCSIFFNEAEARYRFGGSSTNAIKLWMVDESSGYQVTCQTKRGMIHGFNGVGQGNDWNEGGVSTGCRPGGNDQLLQPEINFGSSPLTGTDPGLPSGNGAGSAWTACQQSRAQRGDLWSYDSDANYEDGNPDPLMGGMIIPIGWWLHLLGHITRVSNSQVAVEHFAAYHGETWTRLFSRQDTVESPNPYRTMRLTNSHTSMIAEPGRPVCERWYDGIITRVGSEPIPAPGFSTFSVTNP